MTIKNIALAGHAGTGKTTLMEALLYQGGCTERSRRKSNGIPRSALPRAAFSWTD